tara:strand:+ start:348 stop:908 length:561 start_codon:yes stop_codon:yes gene_type:complete
MKYIYYHYPTFFCSDSINKLNKFISINKLNSNLEDAGADLVVKKVTVNVLTWSTLKKCDVLDNIQDLIEHTNTEAFNFNMQPLNKYDRVNYNTYTPKLKSEFGWHVDGEPFDKKYTLKLTTLINLSEKKFKGGDLHLWYGRDLHVKEFNKPGSIVIFPSFIPHKVTPITQGERKVLTLWTKGSWWQ